MPLPAEPSTRLSRVVPHDACFVTSTSGMPCFEKKPFSFAMINGEASVSAMKPKTALVTSGFAAAAYSGRSARPDTPASVAATAPRITLRRVVLWTSVGTSLSSAIQSPYECAQNA